MDYRSAIKAFPQYVKPFMAQPRIWDVDQKYPAGPSLVFKTSGRRSGYQPHKKRRKRRRLVTPRYLRNPFPMIYRTKMRLRFTIEDSTASPGLIDRTFRANDLFDPLAGFGASQPPFFDQLAAVYNSYRVIKGAFSVSIDNNLSGTVLAALVPSDQTAAITTMRQACGYPFAKHTMIAASAPHIRVMSSHMNTSTITGQSYIRGNDELSALVSASPAHLWYWHLFTQPVAAAEADQVISIVMTFWAEFYDLKILDDA